MAGEKETVMRRFILPILLLLVLPATAQPMPTSGLDGVEVVMSFAHNVGMIPQSVKYKGKTYELDEAADAIIPQIGWSDKEKRTDIAMHWVEQVTTASRTILRQKPEKAKGMKFHQPKVVLFDDGSVEVTLWVRHPAGMLPQVHYSHHRFHFSDAGTLRDERLGSLNIPY